HTPSSRSTSFRVYGATTTSTPTSSLHSASSATSASTAISSLSSSPSPSPSQSPSLPVPSLLTQHQFPALSAVRAELMPFFKKNVLSSSDFRDIAKKVPSPLITAAACLAHSPQSLFFSPS